MAKFATFDAADYLDDEETISEYITASLEDPNHALGVKLSASPVHP